MHNNRVEDILFLANCTLILHIVSPSDFGKVKLSRESFEEIKRMSSSTAKGGMESSGVVPSVYLRRAQIWVMPNCDEGIIEAIVDSWRGLTHLHELRVSVLKCRYSDMPLL